MSIQTTISQYLSEGKLMQVASVRDGQPWVCSVYYVQDTKNNLYWLSLPNRRHSTEITNNPENVAITIAIKYDQPVIGIQAEGSVEIVDSADDVKLVMDDYSKKYGTGEDFYDNFIKGTNQHKLYKLTPHYFVQFDELNSRTNPRQEWRP